MGVDPGTMSYDRLAQAVPPAYGQLIFAQMCMARAHRRYGVPMVSFDDYKARPVESGRVLSQWLRGAGAETPDLAVGFQPAPPVEKARGKGCRATQIDSQGSVSLLMAASQPGAIDHEPASFDPNLDQAVARDNADPEEILLRKLFYSHAGGSINSMLAANGRRAV